ncbi:MAG TPA: thiamine phosphate synthase [Thermoanaerobaculia bacterium]|nr:thiamine phosphate synthase [Thermoanaerobaculia bacterium]
MKGLYVTDRAAIGSERLEEVLARLAGSKGLAVQLREHDCTDRELLSRASRARQILGSTPLSINRRFDVALACGAGGVHLPASGLPVPRVKANTPRGFRVGVSTHSAGEAAAAIEAGADVVVLGPIFDTPSKRAYGKPLGPSALADLPPSSSHDAEVYVIGGMNLENIGQLLPYRDRIAGAAGVRLFQEAGDPLALLTSLVAL